MCTIYIFACVPSTSLRVYHLHRDNKYDMFVTEMGVDGNETRRVVNPKCWGISAWAIMNVGDTVIRHNR